jgi:hypothetical protein
MRLAVVLCVLEASSSLGCDLQFQISVYEYLRYENEDR